MRHPAFARLLRTSGLLLLLRVEQSTAHTWADQLSLIASNGTFYGAAGYPRGFTPRSAALDPRGDANVYELPPDGRSTGNAILPTDLMCKDQQFPGNYSTKYPRLSAYPGAHVAIQYQENGHVTQPYIPGGHGVGSGVVYVYGTTESRADDRYLDIHKVWTPESSPGRLLATRYFDDGQCYEANSAAIATERKQQFPHTNGPLMGANLWCQTDVDIPEDIEGSNYTLYWVWDWPIIDESGDVKLNQSYTSCIDLEIGSTPNNFSSTKVQFVQSQDLNSAAIAKQLATSFIFDPHPTAKQVLYVSGATNTASFLYSPPARSTGATSSSDLPTSAPTAFPSTNSSGLRRPSPTASIIEISSPQRTNSKHSTSVAPTPEIVNSDPLAYTSIPVTHSPVSGLTHGGSNATSTNDAGAGQALASGIVTVTVTIAETTNYVTVSPSVISPANSTSEYRLRGRFFSQQIHQ